jgi:hypothetical protein
MLLTPAEKACQAEGTVNMNVVVSALVAGICLTATQAPTAARKTPTAAQETWLKSFEGAWAVEGAVGSDAEAVVNVTREGTALVLRLVIRDREIVTRYDLSGVDVPNRTAIFRTRIDGQKLVTEIWDNAVAGPPARIETRYMESADRMVTDVVRTPGGEALNRGVLLRKGK